MALIRSERLTFHGGGPVVPESDLIWSVATGTRRSFPVPAYDLDWAGREILIDTGTDAYMLNPERGDGSLFECPGVSFSPDRKYVAAWRGEYRTGVWRLIDRTELTQSLRRQIGGVALQESPPPFWVSGSNGHILCIGVTDAPDWRMFRQSMTTPAWRTVFLDVERMKVLRSIGARLVAPSSDSGAAVVRKGEHFEFVGPEPK
jgi:hypothetical protein